MLTNISYTPPFPLPSLSYCGCHFHADRFTNAAFEENGVYRPVALCKAVAKRKSEFLAGRYCASRALIYLTGKDCQVGINSDRSPDWPDGIVGSITHGAGKAAVVVARSCDYAGLGLDIENILPLSDAQELQDKILNEYELKCNEHNLSDVGFFVTLAFSAKESLYKALYPTAREFMDFHDLHIKNVSENTITLGLLKTLNSRWQVGTDFEVLYVKYAGEILTMAYINNLQKSVALH